MGLNLYKGNKNCTGTALFFSFDSKSQTIYLRLQRQTEWNEEENQSYFKGGHFNSVFLNMLNVSSILRAIKEKIKTSFERNTQEFKFLVTTSPYFQKLSIEEMSKGIAPKMLGIGLTIDITQNSTGEKQLYKIPLSFDESLLIEQWLQFALTHCFTGLYSADIQDGKRRAKERETKREEREELNEMPKPINDPVETDSAEDLF